MKNIFIGFFLLFIGFTSTAQKVVVTGRVISKEDGETLPGVSVVVKGTNTGTTTDLEGKFSLSTDSHAVLVFSYVGYKTAEIALNGKTSIEVQLEANTELLNEVVVVGYGVQKKSDVTGALVSISGDELQQTHQQNIASILQGRAAGVTVTTNSGAPGRDEEITIRGISSINGSPPLWIVDGVPTTGGVNPQDIASMEILKDASATAIYGTKGANGVILITTKKGSQGKMQMEYENRFSWGQLYKKLNLTTAKQWAKLRSEAYSNAGLPIPPSLDGPFGEGTDWQKAITRTAASMNHYLSFSGGNDKLTWFMSANYNNQEGIIKKSDAKSLDLRLNTEAQLHKWLKVGENISFSSSTTHLINEDDEWNAIMMEAIAIDPITKVKKEDGSWDGSKFNTIANPVAHLDRTKDEVKDYSLGGDLFADITFLKDFTFTSRLGYALTFSNNYDWMPTFFVKTGEENSQTSVSRDYYERRDWVFSNYLTWTHQYGNHSVKIMAGNETEQNYAEWFGVTATDLISEAEHLIFIDNATGNQDASSYGLASDIRYISYFGRINYNFSGKYFFTANFRRQGSSMFGPEHRWGDFPSASLGWRLDKESFFENVEIINNLKLRAGYGMSGNDLALQPYSYYATSTAGQRYVFGDKIVDGIAFPRIPNDELHWEEKTSLNIGVDIAMWEDRFSFSGDYFIDKTGQMLYDPDLPGHVGTQEMPFTNVASMQNKGFEMVVGYKNSFKNFKYDLKLNFSHVKNKVLDLGSATYIPAVTFMQLGYISRTEVGHPMASFYGYITDGLFQNQAEIDAYVDPNGNPIQPNAAPGDIRYKADENGKLIMDFIGSPFPDFTAGFNVNLNYKGFSLLMFFYGVYGNEIFNATRFYNFNSSVRYNVDASLMGRWLLEGDTDDPNMARLNINDANNSLRSDRFVEDGSYLRLKNLQLEYNIPQNIFNKTDITSLKIFAGADNLFTLTRYSGFDPEVGIGYNNNPLDRGIDRARYPSPRTFYFGLHLGF
jgi:TonB-linked SusC/RagA family outer membrane protein